MDYSKRLKTRLYVAITYIVLGAILAASTFVLKTDNEFISFFSLALIVMGAVRIRNYLIITRNPESLRKHEIIETDERNISIINRARSAAFTAYFMVCGITVIVLSFMKMYEAARWIGFSVLALAVIYWICYFIVKKRS